MWLSSKGQARPQRTEQAAQIGEVTVAGKETAVFLSGERRNIRTLAPGGYHWSPDEGDTVLVLKTGGEEESCLLGKSQKPPDWVEKGSVFVSLHERAGLLLKKDGSIHLFAGPGAIHLDPEGSISIVGQVTCNGLPIGEPEEGLL